MAELVVLGSGTSNGVPSLAFEYSEEFLAEPKNHRTRPSVVLLGPEGNVLVDCAPEMRLQLLRERVRDIDAVIITHSHADHIMGMDDLRAFCLRDRRPMPIYCRPDVEEDIRRIFPYAFGTRHTQTEVPSFEMHSVGELMRLGGMEVRTAVALHGSLPVIVMRVGDVGYATDVSSLPPEAFELLTGLRVLILDAVRIRPHPTHLHFEAAVQLSRELRAGQTYFTHLSHDYDHRRFSEQLPEGVALAYDGLRVPL